MNKYPFCLDTKKKRNIAITRVEKKKYCLKYKLSTHDKAHKRRPMVSGSPFNKKQKPKNAKNNPGPSGRAPFIAQI